MSDSVGIKFQDLVDSDSGELRVVHLGCSGWPRPNYRRKSALLGTATDNYDVYRYCCIDSSVVR